MNNNSNDRLYELAILGRVTWQMHSLNNEGTVGNVTEPRTIVLADGTRTDGISGEMLKHLHVLKLWELEADKTRRFCSPCQALQPERANAAVQGSSPEDVVKNALVCRLCDLHGFLVERPAVTRPSAIHFGWAVGIPQVQRDIHVHARQAIGEKAKRKKLTDTQKADLKRRGEGKCSQCEKEATWKVGDSYLCDEHVSEAETAQMLYHRPTRSGMYAIVSLFQAWRVGLNNVNWQYVNGNDERAERLKLVLKAYQIMFTQPEMAMSTTRFPHTENFEGIIVWSNTNVPVPTLSPIKSDYKEQIKAIAHKLGSDHVVVEEFKTLAEFIDRIDSLKGKKPYKIRLGAQENSPKEARK